MTYVIAQLCVDMEDWACVDECPVDCIYEGARALYISSLECVDCGTYETVCPTEAILYEGNLPAEWEDYLRTSRDFFDDTGASGGAGPYGSVDRDDPMIAALPLMNQ